MKKIILVALLLAMPTVGYAKQASYPATEEALQNEIINLPWETEPSKYQLSKSSSSLQLPEGLYLIRGEGAERFMYLNQGVEYPNAEAAIINIDENSQIVFEYYDSGFVDIDDWSELDPDDLLKVIRENTKIANKSRVKNGRPEIHVKDWLVEPFLDKENNAAYWAISMTEAGQEMVNTITLKLGKKGYEKLLWVGPKELYSNSDGLLDTMLKEHKFDQGFRYADYSIGDKVAAFGIASLVAVSAGGKSKAGKTTLSAIGIAILLFLKKFIFIPIMIAFGAVWALVKNLFSKKRIDDGT